VPFAAGQQGCAPRFRQAKAIVFFVALDRATFKVRTLAGPPKGLAFICGRGMAGDGSTQARFCRPRIRGYQTAGSRQVRVVGGEKGSRTCEVKLPPARMHSIHFFN